MNIARPVLFAIAALGLIGAAPVRVADPMKMLNYLVGRWNCSSSVGGTTTTYAADYTYALGGKWIRTINSSKRYQSEDMMAYANHRWMVVDMEPTGLMSVLDATDTGAAHIAMRTAYPRPGLTVTFDRLTKKKYTLKFGGTLGGKPAHWVDTCTKA